MSKSPTSSLGSAGGDDRFRVLVDSVKDYAIFMLDRDGRVQTWNTGAAIIKGYGADEIIGRHIDLFYTAAACEEGLPTRLLARARDEGRAEDEGWRVRKDGSRFWAGVVMTSVRDEGGDLVGYAKVVRDLSVRPSAEEALRQQQEVAHRRVLEEERLHRARAEEAVRVREEFLSVASHELKTPLTALQIDLYAIKEHLTDPDKLSKKIERAARNADRLGGLIESLLNVSRISSGKLTLKASSMDLTESVGQVMENVRAIAAKAGCELHFETKGPVLGVWDRLRLDQVTTDLLANAVKFGAGGPITVLVRSDQNEAVLEVCDRGPGIPEQDLTRIFGRFEHSSSTRHYAGLGLGLYVSREIVEAMKGTIRADNRPGGGACFTVRLPLRSSSSEDSTVTNP